MRVPVDDRGRIEHEATERTEREWVNLKAVPSRSIVGAMPVALQRHESPETPMPLQSQEHSTQIDPLQRSHHRAVHAAGASGLHPGGPRAEALCAIQIRQNLGRAVGIFHRVKGGIADKLVAQDGNG